MINSYNNSKKASDANDLLDFMSKNLESYTSKMKLILAVDAIDIVQNNDKSETPSQLYTLKNISKIKMNEERNQTSAEKIMLMNHQLDCLERMP